MLGRQNPNLNIHRHTSGRVCAIFLRPLHSNLLILLLSNYGVHDSIMCLQCPNKSRMIQFTRKLKVQNLERCNLGISSLVSTVMTGSFHFP